MFSAGVISGAFRMMMDIIKYIDKKKFQVIVAYKPKYAQWGAYEKDSIMNSGIKLVPLRGKSLFDPRGFIDLWNILHKEKIDIIHSWDVLGVPARIIGKLAKVKIVEEIANPPPKLISQISLKHYLINKMTSVLVDGFIACSNEIMNRYHEKKLIYLKNRLLAVIYNCVEIPDFEISTEKIVQIRKEYDLRDREVVLTNIGYFNEQKAQSDLLLAFKQIVTRRSDVRLFIVGWGPLEQKLMKLTKQLTLQDKVIFTGKLNRQEVFEILSITDLFVLSSHWEGFGIVLAEAMALGKPVVSTDTDGSREVVANGKSGIIVPVNDPRSLTDAILHLLARPDLMLEMGQEGLKRVNKLFNCEQFAEGYEKFYETVFLVS
jgi:glycosyltransferase involved in cell wall biosynthesis